MSGKGPPRTDGGGGVCFRRRVLEQSPHGGKVGMRGVLFGPFPRPTGEGEDGGRSFRRGSDRLVVSEIPPAKVPKPIGKARRIGKLALPRLHRGTTEKDHGRPPLPLRAHHPPSIRPLTLSQIPYVVDPDSSSGSRRIGKPGEGSSCRRSRFLIRKGLRQDERVGRAWKHTQTSIYRPPASCRWAAPLSIARPFPCRAGTSAWPSPCGSPPSAR
jgi:hypothetical protein